MDNSSLSIDGMSLEEKIGQMLIINYSSSKVDNKLKEMLNDVKPGGFILFRDNMSTYEETLKFIKDIKSSSDVPMFISIDQEGGNVQRLLSLKNVNVSNIPYMYDVGLLNDKFLAYDVGVVIGEELRVLGVNMDFAPVVDVYTNLDNKVIGRRSFGSDPSLVAILGSNLAKGLESANVIPVFKHFPGHGDTSVDSHYALPVLNKSKNDLASVEFIPFIEAINNGASAIMVGHIAVSELSSNTPATMSSVIINDLLKGELGFKGLVISDALNMGALSNNYSEDEIYVKTILAGCDILLMPKNPLSAINTIKKAVLDGVIDEERINESVRKILKIKNEKIKDTYNEYLPVSYFNSDEHQKVLSKIK